MWPVFVFGTGRCGSTHIQRLITLSTCCWIWGEHDGFLEPVLASLSRYGNSKLLERTAFRFVDDRDDQLISDMTVGSERLSWLNRLNRDQLRTEVALLVDRMFRSDLPSGWAQWGFKEIRYGLGNQAPAALLSLFPSATAIFTFREPSRTIQSMIKTWGRTALLDDEACKREFSETYHNCARMWITLLRYFLEYRQNEGKKIHFVSDDKLNFPVEQILSTLGLPCTRTIPKRLEVTNPGPTKWPFWAKETFDDLFSKDEVECTELYSRGRIESDVDFGAVRSEVGLRTARHAVT